MPSPYDQMMMPPPNPMMGGGMPPGMPMDPSMMAPPGMGGPEMPPEAPMEPPAIPEELLGAGAPPTMAKALMWVPVDPQVEIDGPLCESIGGKAVKMPDGLSACMVAPEGEKAPLPPGVTLLDESYAVSGDSGEPPIDDMGGMDPMNPMAMMPPPPMPPDMMGGGY